MDKEETRPEGRISNISSQLSRVSTTSSACIKAKAERAALMERVAAKKKKTQEEQLKKRKGKS